jgi:hypothetical protein
LSPLCIFSTQLEWSCSSVQFSSEEGDASLLQRQAVCSSFASRHPDQFVLSCVHLTRKMAHSPTHRGTCCVSCKESLRIQIFGESDSFTTIIKLVVSCLSSWFSLQELLPNPLNHRLPQEKCMSVNKRKFPWKESLRAKTTQWKEGLNCSRVLRQNNNKHLMIVCCWQWS